MTSPSTKSSRSRPPPPGSDATSTARSTSKPSTGSCTPPTTSSPGMPPSPTSCPSSPHVSPGNASVALSGGSEPGDQVNPSAIAAMKERGIDISTEYPKPWTDEIVRAADVVITMGCGDACPVFPGQRYEEWTLDDPAGLDVAAVRPIRDEIERRVLTLLDRLGVPA